MTDKQLQALREQQGHQNLFALLTPAQSEVLLDNLQAQLDTEAEVTEAARSIVMTAPTEFHSTQTRRTPAHSFPAIALDVLSSGAKPPELREPSLATSLSHHTAAPVSKRWRSALLATLFLTMWSLLLYQWSFTKGQQQAKASQSVACASVIPTVVSPMAHFPRTEMVGPMLPQQAQYLFVKPLHVEQPLQYPEALSLHDLDTRSLMLASQKFSTRHNTYTWSIPATNFAFSSSHKQEVRLLDSTLTSPSTSRTY